MHSRRVVLLCRYTVVSNVISRFVVSQKLICQNESLIVSRCFMADKSLYGVISKFTFVIFLTVIDRSESICLCILTEVQTECV